METERVRCEGLVLRYGSFTALRHVDFACPPGQSVALIGANGAGKSSLLKCLAGWLRPTDGSVFINGRAFLYHERALRQLVKLVPDTPAFYPELTAWEHFLLVSRANRIADWESPAATILEAFGLDRQRNAYPSSFSRGMQYKLALALVLVARPSLLLLDEPYGPLDPFSQLYLAERIAALRETGVTVIFSTHLLPPRHPPDRVVVLEQGEIVADLPQDAALAYGADDLAALPDRLLTTILKDRRRIPHG